MTKAKPKTRSTGRNKRTLRLYYKPPRAPKWWPRDAKGVAIYVGALRNGAGWVIGNGDLMNDDEIEMTRTVVKWDLPTARFRVVDTAASDAKGSS